MDTKELRRAYATLGLHDGASLAEARVAYLTWVALIGEASALSRDGEENVGGPIDLIHHELDLAWHVIEQAHEDGILFPRRPGGCQACCLKPAGRVTTHSVGPGRLRHRLSTSSAVLCRDCGLRTARAARRACLRSGWRGLLAPFATARALSQNGTEIAYLRQTGKNNTASLGAPESAPRAPGLAGHRLVGLVAGFAAIALAVGIALPTKSGPEADPGGTVPSIVQAGVDGPAED